MIFYAPWSDSPNQQINTYDRQLDRRQWDCATLRVDVSDTNKVTHFVQQIYQSGVFEANLLEEWEASADQSWEATKNEFGDHFGIVTRARNREAKRSGFESTKSLCKNPPFSQKPLPPTPTPTQSSREYYALSEYAAAMEDQVDELQSVSGEATAVNSEMEASSTTTSTTLSE